MTQQEDEREFFERLGRAIGKWQLVEMQIFRVYARLANCAGGEPAVEAFHKVIGFRRRLKKVDTVVKARHAASPTLFNLADWHDLYRNAAGQADIRNELAHWTIYFVVSTGEIRPEEAGPWLRPNHFDPKHQEVEKRHGVVDLGAAVTAFDALAGAIRAFANSLPLPPGLPPLA